MKSVDWVITYRVVGDNKEQTMEVSLHFNKSHNVGRWFKNCHSGTGGRRDLEFINAKIKEKVTDEKVSVCR